MNTLSKETIVFILAIILGIIFTLTIVSPKILKPNCFLDTNSCSSIKYRRKDNTALIQIIPDNIYMWYNGKYLFIYGSPESCPDINTEPVFMLQKDGVLLGYGCINKLEDVKKLYSKEEDQYIFYHLDKDKQNRTAIDILNKLIEEGIII